MQLKPITAIVVLIMIASLNVIGCTSSSSPKSYNRAAGYPEKEVDNDEDEEEERGGDEEEYEETDSDEGEEEEIDSDKNLVKELRAIQSTIKNGFEVVAILLLIILGVMVYLLLHLTRFVLAP